MSEIPIWYRVLYHYYAKDYFYNGLTIPFLIGTNKVITPNSQDLSIDKFLNQLTDETLNEKISIQKCSDIGEYVIGIIDKETISYPYGKAIVKKFGNLCVTDNSFCDISDFQKVKNDLKNIYQDKIDNSLYSINLGSWSYYTESDILKINQILNKK